MEYNKFKEFHWMARHQRVTKHAQQKDEPKKKKKVSRAQKQKQKFIFLFSFYFYCG